MGDVDGVIREPLVVPRHQDHVHGDRKPGRSGGQLGDQRSVKTVLVVIACFEYLRRVGRAHTTPWRPIPDIGRGITHSLYQAPDPRREVLAQEMGCLLRDVADQAVSVFLVGNDAEHRQQKAQVGGHRGLEKQLLVDQLLHFAVDRVDGRLPPLDDSEGGSIAVEKGFRGQRQLSPTRANSSMTLTSIS